MKSHFYLRPLLLLCCAGIMHSTTISQSVSGVINTYYKVTGVNVIPNTVTVPSAAGLTPGLKILIIQMKGASINSTNTSSFGNLTSIGNAGNYEFNYICGISGNNVLLQYQLLRSYDVAGSVQLIPIPQFSSVTVTDTVKASNWNAGTGTGGVVVMEATNTIFLNAPIDVSGKGFSGGALVNYAGCVWSTDVTAYTLPAAPADPNTNGARKGEGIADFIPNGDYGRGKQANGGGGGNNHNTGGAGGSNYGIGGNGGTRSNETFFACHGLNPGIGGLTLSGSGYTAPNNRIFMGGGGGGGHQNNSVGTPGGNGGGIIILLANAIESGGEKLIANGAAPYNPACSNPFFAEGDGGGGGGAGGTIVLHVNQINGTLSTDVAGANGSVSGNATNNCTGPGGGGGGGVLWVSNAGVLGAITAINTGGTNGTISMVNSTPACRGLANGATSGGNGVSLSGYSLPVATNFVCAPLASGNLISFYGKTNSGYNLISWSVADADNILNYQLERSSNMIRYEVIAQVNNAGQRTMNFEDNKLMEGVINYRLRIVYKNGGEEYSKVISLKRIGNNYFNWLSISPNPTNNFLKIGIVSYQPGALQISLLNQLGQRVYASTYFVKKGSSTISFSLPSISPGIYFARLELNGSSQVKKILIQNR